jgi:hypothetical protein
LLLPLNTSQIWVAVCSSREFIHTNTIPLWIYLRTKTEKQDKAFHFIGEMMSLQLYLLSLFVVSVFVFSTAEQADLQEDSLTPPRITLRGSATSNLPNPLTHSIDPSRYQNVRWEDHADPKVQQYFQTRKLYVSELNKTMHEHLPHHKKAWQALEVVNGLKNDDVLIFVTSTSAKDEIYLWER